MTTEDCWFMVKGNYSSLTKMFDGIIIGCGMCNAVLELANHYENVISVEAPTVIEVKDAESYKYFPNTLKTTYLHSTSSDWSTRDKYESDKNSIYGRMVSRLDSFAKEFMKVA